MGGSLGWGLERSTAGCEAGGALSDEAQDPVAHLRGWQRPSYTPVCAGQSGLLQAFWEGEGASELLAGLGLQADTVSVLGSVRQQRELRQRAVARARLQEQVFFELPDPVLVQGADFAIWNRAFSPLLRRLQAGDPEATLLDHAVVPACLQQLATTVSFSAARPFLFAVDDEIWLVRHRVLPDGCHAHYFEGPLLQGVRLPERAPEVVLLRASGFALKEIAGVTGLSIWQVSNRIQAHQDDIAELYTLLCREPAR